MFKDIVVLDIHCSVFPLKNVICWQSMSMHPGYILVMKIIFSKKYLKTNSFVFSSFLLK